MFTRRTVSPTSFGKFSLDLPDNRGPFGGNPGRGDLSHLVGVGVGDGERKRGEAGCL